MSTKTAQQAADNWKNAMANPATAQRYKDGIANFQGNPMALAATNDAQQRYMQNTAAAVTSGRMAAKLNATDPNTWRSNAQNFGAQKLAMGGQKGYAKAQKAFAMLAPIWGQMRSAVQGMPKGGLQNALARQAAALTVLMQATGKA